MKLFQIIFNTLIIHSKNVCYVLTVSKFLLISLYLYLFLLQQNYSFFKLFFFVIQNAIFPFQMYLKVKFSVSGFILLTTANAEEECLSKLKINFTMFSKHFIHCFIFLLQIFNQLVLPTWVTSLPLFSILMKKFCSCGVSGMLPFFTRVL